MGFAQAMKAAAKQLGVRLSPLSHPHVAENRLKQHFLRVHGLGKRVAGDTKPIASP
jgi:hypothetical protein